MLTLHKNNFRISCTFIELVLRMEFVYTRGITYFLLVLYSSDWHRHISDPWFKYQENFSSPKFVLEKFFSCSFFCIKLFFFSAPSNFYVKLCCYIIILAEIIFIFIFYLLTAFIGTCLTPEFIFKS